MTLLKRADEQTQSDWRPVDEGLWRWRVGAPQLKLSEKYGKYQVGFQLNLTTDEQRRLTADNEAELKSGDQQQSFRTYYTVGLSLGFMNKTGQYESTKLVDFLAACLGIGQTKKFREWIAQGGGPPRPDDLDDQKAELEAIEDWLRWWEDLEVYGTIAHRAGSNGTIYANFAGPMAIGSLPGHKDPDYDAHGRGKLRALIAESGGTREEKSREHRGVTEAPPVQRFTAEGKESEFDDLPF